MSTSSEDPVGRLERWEAYGATWRVLSRRDDAITVSLCRCDGGEEVDRLTSGDPALRAYLDGRWSNED